MKESPRGVGRSRDAFAALLALVLLFRLLVPGGYMIGSDDAGRIGLILCGSAGAAAAESDEHHKAGHEMPAEPVQPPCPYAALAAPVLPPLPPLAVPPPPIGDSRTESGWEGDPVRPAPAAPPPPATGPPLPV